jgi:hypothetical protein
VEGIVPKQTCFQEGLYWVDVERDLAYMPKRIFRQKESLWKFLEPYLHSHVSAVYDLQDLKPFLKRYLDFSQQAVKRLLKTPQSNQQPGRSQ